MIRRLQQLYFKTDKLLIARGLAALGVVYAHVLQFAYYGIPPFYRNVFQPLSLVWPDGNAAVLLFFVLSGYLLGKAFFTGRYLLTKAGLKTFYFQRIRRIFPLYYFVILITSVFVFPGIFLQKNWLMLTNILTFTYDARTATEWYNVVIWSLAVEVQFYVILPLIYWLIRPFVTKQNIFIAFSIAVLGFSLFKHYYEYTGGHLANIILGNALIQSLDFFVIGMLVYPALTLFPKIRAFAARFNGLAIVVLIGLFAAVNINQFYGFHVNNRTGPGYYAFAIACIVALFIYLAESNKFQSKPTKFKFSWHELITNPFHVFEFLGELSYGIYLWHYIIYVSLLKSFPISGEPYKNVFLFCLFGLVVVMALSIITYYAIEKPFFRTSKPHSSPIQSDSVAM